LIDEVSDIVKHISKTLVKCNLEFIEKRIQDILPDQCVNDLSDTSKAGINVMSELKDFT
jgi:hypothetical protein